MNKLGIFCGVICGFSCDGVRGGWGSPLGVPVPDEEEAGGFGPRQGRGRASPARQGVVGSAARRNRYRLSLIAWRFLDDSYGFRIFGLPLRSKPSYN